MSPLELVNTFLHLLLPCAQHPTRLTTSIAFHITMSNVGTRRFVIIDVKLAKGDCISCWRAFNFISSNLHVLSKKEGLDTPNQMRYTHLRLLFQPSPTNASWEFFQKKVSGNYHAGLMPPFLREKQLCHMGGSSEGISLVHMWRLAWSVLDGMLDLLFGKEAGFIDSEHWKEVGAE